jgi:acetoin utilization deacetylase AcuC-like enzyme
MSRTKSGTSRATVLVLTNPSHTGHAWPGHLERPERIGPVLAGVRAEAEAAGAAVVEATAPPATPDLAATVHDEAYVGWLSRTDETGFLDADTYVAAGSPEAAFAAAGQSVAAGRAVLDREATVAFAVARPPGHHAGRFGGTGFCLLNNVALAVSAVRSADPDLRVVVLDWDLHHGNGSQELFGPDTRTFYASTHQFPFYPGTGSAAEQGERLLNVPLPAGSGDGAFVAAWTETILPRAEAFGPDLILVSAGFDAHRDDPLSGLDVTETGYGAVAQAVGALAHRRGLGGVALSLEGGYHLDALRASTTATLRGLLSGLAGTPVGESHI